MEDIFQWCREGNAMQVRVWLDDTENDMNQGWASGFSQLLFFIILSFSINNLLIFGAGMIMGSALFTGAVKRDTLNWLSYLWPEVPGLMPQTEETIHRCI